MAPSTLPKFKPAPEMSLQGLMFEPEQLCPAGHGEVKLVCLLDKCKPMPEHWKVPLVKPGRPSTYLAAVLWRLLCIISIFRPDLKDLWAMKTTTEGWKTQEQRSVKRLANSNTAVRPLTYPFFSA